MQARAVSSTAINASWSEVPAIDQNGIITVYEVMYTPLMTFEGAIGTLVVNTSSMSVVLDMLQEDVDYSISVRAYTSQGPSNFSDPITQKTNQDGEFLCLINQYLFSLRCVVKLIGVKSKCCILVMLFKL